VDHLESWRFGRGFSRGPSRSAGRDCKEKHDQKTRGRHGATEHTSTPQKNDAFHINLLETERSLVALGCDAAFGIAGGYEAVLRCAVCYYMALSESIAVTWITLRCDDWHTWQPGRLA
jgi:hypothetical protein